MRIYTDKELFQWEKDRKIYIESSIDEPVISILEFYNANSKVGEKQEDGTYKIIVENSKALGSTYITFDPKPAKQALQKINEVIE